ncbi:MAG: YhjD/YihY/BrkB family envelope integrity protein [Opitutaceae bacterium]|jgi:membrane protein
MSQSAKSPGWIVSFFEKEIWKPENLSTHSPKGWLYAFIRVISITWTVFNETKAASRAAALSYNSLLGLGPLVAIAMLVAGFMLDKKDPDLAVNTFNRLIKFVAPQISQYEKISGAEMQHTGSVKATQAQMNPELANLINGFIQGSKSGTVGAAGALSLIFIVLMLFTSVENAFNEIWGVRRGRSWLLRVVFYWTIVTLGAVLFFASLTMLGAGAFVNVFVEKLPFGATMLTALRWALPIGSVVLLIGVLTLFNRYVPNTHVFWRAALIGAVVVAALIFLNNLMAFFYFRRVLQSRSLYGSVGIVPILMLGLYIFWLFVLVGGQVSYAVQNVHFRNSQAAWSQLAETMRERLSLVVLLTICRRFQECLDPCTAAELGDRVRVPTQIINECLNRLVDMKLVTPVPSAPGAASNDYRYQPARPLNRITLQEFKRLDDSLGSDPTGTTLSRLDPILNRYDKQLDEAIATSFFTQPLDQLLAEHPFDAATPPVSDHPLRSA